MTSTLNYATMKPETSFFSFTFNSLRYRFFYSLEICLESVFRNYKSCIISLAFNEPPPLPSFPGSHRYHVTAAAQAGRTHVLHVAYVLLEHELDES